MSYQYMQCGCGWSGVRIHTQRRCPDCGMAARFVRRAAVDRDALYAYICDYKREHDGNSPTLRQMMAALGISSSSMASGALDDLEAAGRIVRGEHGQAAHISVVGARWVPPEVT